MFEIEVLDFIPNIFILGGLVGIVEFFKRLDVKQEKKRSPKYYSFMFVIFCLFSGIALALIENPEKIGTLIAQSILFIIVYWGWGTLGYQTIIKFVKKIMDKFAEGK